MRGNRPVTRRARALRRRPPPQPSRVDTGEGEPRSGWEGAGTNASALVVSAMREEQR
jgi:hypothetical protein